MRGILFGLAASLLLAYSGCATLGLGIEAPRFSVASEQPAELRLLGPSVERPLGGAAVRLYARVENPNPVGLTLSRIAGTLLLEGTDAATADFPLGLPLRAGEVTTVPLDIGISFQDLPALADIVGRALTRGDIGYSLRGTASVDAGALGQPTFGPMTLLQGRMQVMR